PNGSIEFNLKKIIDNSLTVQYKKKFSMEQIAKKRIWWTKGYKSIASTISKHLDFEKNEYLVYSNNPFAYELISILKNLGCNIYFDVMDNFSIHPSLLNNERQEALKGYINVFKNADIISANSEQTCNYMKEYTQKKVHLVKNGVFTSNEIQKNDLEQFHRLVEYKNKYKKCIGYIGKIGKRLDADLIEKISKAKPDYLFVFVGYYLKDQVNPKLTRLFKEDNNVIHINGIPSAFVYKFMNEFDILTIPHSVGKNENGGDPLKLYQYLTRNKPIITTPILGVSEFKDYIKISDSPEEWINFIKNPNSLQKEVNTENFSWNKRLEPIYMFLEEL
ncbi:MAG: hypothetical protein HUJ68_08740, partial [Clostridia bacterium]|nr:hypothetical protein [Clostridia bacterium]